MPHLILTPGDPTGIGPEITVKALQRLGEFPAAMQLTVIGSVKALERTAKALKKELPHTKQVVYHPIEVDQPGEVAYQAIEAAVRMIADKKADALVTGPISKRNLIAAGHNFPGHTEILEALAQKCFGVKDARAEMLFVHKKMRMLLLTRHIALGDVPAALAKPGAIARPLKTLIQFLRERLKIPEPRIALLGVNPHSGEVGGEEERKLFGPVIKAVNTVGNTHLGGPFAADGFFRGYKGGGEYDAIVAAYHDQGLIPFKMLAGYEAVNMTIGLPFIRTSVSHGTADDIEGRNLACEDSLIAALHAALEVL